MSPRTASAPAWVPANAWLVEDVTDRLAPGAAAPLTHTIDRAKFLRDKGVSPRPGVDDARSLTMQIIPREAVASVAGVHYSTVRKIIKGERWQP